MARANFVKSAQKDIYLRGKRVEYLSEKGKRAGQMKSKLDRSVPADETDIIFIAKGESYYWWQFKNSNKSYSKTPPKASQLTQSNFLSQLYELEERIADFTAEDKDDFDNFKQDLLSDIENLKDECQQSLDNMPESLQSAPTGELLTERIDGLDSWHSEIDGVECDYDEDSIRAEKTSEIEREEGEEEDDYNTRIDEAVKEETQPIIDTAIEELHGASHGL